MVSRVQAVVWCEDRSAAAAVEEALSVAPSWGQVVAQVDPRVRPDVTLPVVMIVAGESVHGVAEAAAALADATSGDRYHLQRFEFRQADQTQLTI